MAYAANAGFFLSRFLAFLENQDIQVFSTGPLQENGDMGIFKMNVQKIVRYLEERV
jgi:hypothetical protein